MKMYDGVIKRVKMLEAKHCINYTTPKDKPYKIFRIIYIVAFCYGLAVNFLYAFSMFVLGRVDSSASFLAYILTPALCSAALIVGFVLLLKQKNIAGGILSIVPSVILAIFFYPLSYAVEANTTQAKYYWRHLIPMILIAFTALVLSIIAERAKIKLEKMYNKVIENIYTNYKVNIADGGDITADQWEEFLEKFDPVNYQKQFLKNQEDDEKSDDAQA